MPRATCRCGQVLSVPVNGPDRVICPMCSARVRVRQDESNSGPGDGYMRFNCVCGRRLKVRRGGPTQQAGKCPDCGRIVPVPSTASSQSLRVMAGGSDAMNTQELDDADLAALEDWSQAWRARAQDSEANGDGSEAALASPPDILSVDLIECGIPHATGVVSHARPVDDLLGPSNSMAGKRQEGSNRDQVETHCEYPAMECARRIPQYTAYESMKGESGASKERDPLRLCGFGRFASVA